MKALLFVVYLITFRCYGTYLPGDGSSVDRDHNVYLSRLPEANPALLIASACRMRQRAYELDAQRREIVLAGICAGCEGRGWELIAAHVRTSHVHAVVAAECAPDLVMNALKAYASRELNQAGVDEPDRRRWARHGSTRWLLDARAIENAIRYVIEWQGQRMAIKSPSQPCGREGLFV